MHAPRDLILPVRSHLLQFLPLPGSPFNYDYTNEFIHWLGQHPHDPITFPKLHLWQRCWEPCLQHRNFWVTFCIKPPNSFLYNDKQMIAWNRHILKWGIGVPGRVVRLQCVRNVTGWDQCFCDFFLNSFSSLGTHQPSPTLHSLSCLSCSSRTLPFPTSLSSLSIWYSAPYMEPMNPKENTNSCLSRSCVIWHQGLPTWKG